MPDSIQGDEDSHAVFGACSSIEHNDDGNENLAPKRAAYQLETVAAFKMSKICQEIRVSVTYLQKTRTSDMSRGSRFC